MILLNTEKVNQTHIKYEIGKIGLFYNRTRISVSILKHSLNCYLLFPICTGNEPLKLPFLFFFSA